MEKVYYSPLEEKAEKEENRCIPDFEIGWLGRETGTALSGCVSLGPDFFV